MPEETPAPETGTEGDPQPTPLAPPPEPAAPEPKPTETVDFWKQKAREQEKRAKSNADAAKELEELRASMMSEQEKAVAEAEARGRQTAVGEVGQKLAAAEIKAAISDMVADPVALIEDLNLSKYVTDEGDVDLEAVEKLRKKFERGETPQPKPTGRQRPTENLPRVALPTDGAAPLPDMDDWMRRKASS